MNQQHLRAFSARACAAPIQSAADRFTEQTGIAVELMVCRRHCHEPIVEEASVDDVTGTPHFLTEVAEIEGLDLVVAGAGYLCDDGELMGILDPQHRVCLGYRRSALLVQPGNPKGIRDLRDLERPDVSVSISIIDCLKGAYESLLAATHRSERIRPQIKLRANGCVALVQSVAQGWVDVGIGWGAFQHLAPGEIEIIELDSHLAVERETTISLCRRAANPDAAIRLLEFLRGGGSDEFLLRDGWLLPEARD